MPEEGFPRAECDQYCAGRCPEDAEDEDYDACTEDCGCTGGESGEDE